MFTILCEYIFKDANGTPQCGFYKTRGRTGGIYYESDTFSGLYFDTLKECKEWFKVKYKTNKVTIVNMTGTL